LVQVKDMVAPRGNGCDPVPRIEDAGIFPGETLPEWTPAEPPEWTPAQPLSELRFPGERCRGRER
jgi:hypothetical protein